jgi:AcrR family transcriptional regulator
MGRKNLAEARTNEILEAFARAMVKYGLDTTLEQVADEAQMTRSIIRHYIGNREDVVNALITRITQDYLVELQTVAQTIPPADMLEATLDYLFGEQTLASEYDKLIIDVLMTAQERYPHAKRQVIQLLEALINLFVDDLVLAYPKATREQCHDVAYSIVVLAISHDSFMWIGMNPSYRRAARASAEVLLKTLG